MAVRGSLDKGAVEPETRLGSLCCVATGCSSLSGPYCPEGRVLVTAGVPYNPDFPGLGAHQPPESMQASQSWGEVGRGQLLTQGPASSSFHRPGRCSRQPGGCSTGTLNSWEAGRQDLRCVQKSPVQPGVQRQAPSSALQLPPLWQLHVWKQAGPQKPGGQAGGWVGCRGGDREAEPEGEEGGLRISQDARIYPGRISWLS